MRQCCRGAAQTRRPPCAFAPRIAADGSRKRGKDKINPTNNRMDGHPRRWRIMLIVNTPKKKKTKDQRDLVSNSILDRDNACIQSLHES